MICVCTLFFLCLLEGSKLKVSTPPPHQAIKQFVSGRIKKRIIQSICWYVLPVSMSVELGSWKEGRREGRKRLKNGQRLF